MNWISATGLRPWAAMPTAVPVINVSASGVSITRRKPKRSCSPRVARNTPPLGPTSSPSTTTSGSSAMARCSARLMASTMHSVGCSTMFTPCQCRGAGQQLIALLTIAFRQLLIQMLKRRCRISLGNIPKGLHRGIDLFTELFLHGLLALLIPEPLLMQEALQTAYRLVLPGLGQLVGGAIAAGIIRGGM